MPAIKWTKVDRDEWRGVAPDGTEYLVSCIVQGDLTMWGAEDFLAERDIMPYNDLMGKKEAMAACERDYERRTK